MSMPDQSMPDPDQEPIEIPPLTGVLAEPLSAGKLLRQMRFFGPAAIIASLSLGAGETIMATGLGAWSEYGLLWLLLLSVVVKGVFVTYLIGRYTAVTGQPLSERLILLPGPRGWLLLGVVVSEVFLISMGLTTVAKPCGNLLAYLHFDEWNRGLPFAFWENAWTSMLLGFALLVGLVSNYKWLERQQIVICGLIVAVTIAAAVIIQPDMERMFVGALSIGHMPPAPEWAPPAARHEYVLNLVTVFAYVGGSLSGYLAYSNWISLNGWGLNSHPEIDSIRARAVGARRIDYLPHDPGQARRLRVLLSPLRWDVGMGAVVLFVVTAAFLTAGAAVLFPEQKVVGGNEWELLTSQASIWRRINSQLVPIYYVAVILALWGTLASVPEAVARVAHDFLGTIWPRFRSFPERGVQAILVAWFFLASLVWTWSGISFNIMTQLASFVTLGVLLSVVFICTVYFNFTLPALYRPSRWVLVGGIGSALILLACTYGAAVGLARKFIL